MGNEIRIDYVEPHQSILQQVAPESGRGNKIYTAVVLDSQIGKTDNNEQRLGYDKEIIVTPVELEILWQI